MQADFLKAGVVNIDITPPVGYWMGGYGARTEPSKMVHDPLELKIISLFDGLKRIAIVSADLVSFSNEFCTKVKKEISKTTGFAESDVLLACSHTHTGPLINKNYSYLPNAKYFSDDYNSLLVKKICGGINEAVTNEEAVKVYHAKGKASISINRRKTTASGSVEMVPNPDGFVDDDVQVVKFQRLDGSIHSVIFKACCHPTTLGAKYEISADFPGTARRKIEKFYPGASAMFINGCAGDVRPPIIDNNKLFTAGTFEDVERLGNILAGEVIKCCETADELKNIKLKSRLVKHSLEFDPELVPQNRENVDSLRDKVIKSVVDLKPYADRWAECIKEKLRSKVELEKALEFNFMMIEIGELTIAALPGEVMVEYGLKIKERAGAKKVIVAAYSNEDIDYVPTRQVISEGGYEAYGGFVFDNYPAPYSLRIEEDFIKRILEELVD